MTDNKTRQEGPPATDPAQLDSGGRDPEPIREPAPAADQESKPAKKKKIIVVKGSDSGMTAADTRPDAAEAEAEAEGADWQDMTPHEFIEYAQGNPAAARQDIQEYFIAKFGREESEKLKEQAIKAAKAMSEAADSAVFNAMQAIAVKNQVAQQFERIQRQIFNVIAAVKLPEGANIDDLDLFLDEWDALEPFADAIIADYPAYNGMSTADLLDSLPFWWLFYMNDPDAIDDRARDAQEAADIKSAIEIIKRARAARDQAAAAAAEAAAAEAREELPTVTYTKRQGIELTTDKLMTVFFGANAPAAPKGQIPGQMAFLPVKYEKTGAPEITLYYTYDFDDDLFKRLKLEKKIDDEDYFLLSFIASYWRGGEKTVSVVKLYKDMTGENPNSKQLTALTNRLIKIAGTNIFINDKEVRQAWKIEDESKTYREILTPLAPIRVGAERFVTRGQVVEAGIEILAEPDIMKLGYEMGQYTTVPKVLLHVKKKNGRKLTRTPRFYRVLHFLIRRVAGIKSGNLPHKILYDSFYAEIGETTPRGRQLARDCMYTVLDHFKACDKWITGYREETTATTGKVGVRIFCADATNNRVTIKK